MATTVENIFDPEIFVIDSDYDSITEELNPIETHKNEIQKQLVSRREFFKANSVRVPIMILAEEAVKNVMMMAPYLNQYITV